MFMEIGNDRVVLKQIFGKNTKLTNGEKVCVSLERDAVVGFCEKSGMKYDSSNAFVLMFDKKAW